MKSKCNFCQYNKIIKVMYYDIIFDKCDECDYLMCDLSTFKTLEFEILKHFNIGNIKKCYGLNELSKLDRFICKLFMSSIKIKITNKISNDKLCNVCKYPLFKCTNNFLYCNECGRLYFLKNNFDNLINKKIKYIKIIERILNFLKKNILCI